MNLFEKKIVRKIREGNIYEFEVLFKKYYEMLCAFGYKYLENIEQIEEVVQDTFYNIWKNRTNLNIKTSMKSYLYTAVKNNCLQVLRTRSLDIKYENYYKANQSNKSISPIQELNAKELAKIIDKTLNALPERCQKIFRMSRYEGFKYQEIADKLKISVKTVEANMSKALKSFRGELKEYSELIS
ncbi:MAG: RNA polymerase sigma-70 factor [Bacteroidales bacterium]|nr:RNA polymerase sigma-70 factor [Bacteroidales bacterium]